MSDGRNDRRMAIKSPVGRVLSIRRRITFTDDRVETFYTDDGTGYPRFDEHGVVLNYFHLDGRPAVFRASEIRRFVALG